jgi:hypothetical protein
LKSVSQEEHKNRLLLLSNPAVLKSTSMENNGLPKCVIFRKTIFFGTFSDLFFFSSCDTIARKKIIRNPYNPDNTVRESLRENLKFSMLWE